MDPWIQTHLILTCGSLRRLVTMNALRSFVALALLLCAAAPLASAAESAGESSPHSVYISITNDGKSNLGVFFAGNETERRYPPAPPDGEITVIQNSDFEALTEVLGPGENTRHGTHFDHAFVIRTADMQFRAKITVFKGDVGSVRGARLDDLTRSPARSTRRRPGRCDGRARWRRRRISFGRCPCVAIIRRPTLHPCLRTRED